MPKTWETTFEDEIVHARQAQAEGNHGLARVCARRAAGAAAGEYLRRMGWETIAPGVIDRLRAIAALSACPTAAHQPIGRLLLRVDEEFRLPEGVDLIAEAIKLKNVLLE